MTRLDFIHSLAFCVVSAVAGDVLGSVAAETPLLKVGVLSDIHLSDEAYRPSKSEIRIFEKTLRFYRQEGVDAVIIAGDLTNGGRMSEMRVVTEAWKRVFSDGAEPVKVFVTGNHERAFYEKAKKAGQLTETICTDALYADIRKNWRDLFAEEWSPLFIKTVKGYSFVGAHWNENLDEKTLRAFLDAHRTCTKLVYQPGVLGVQPAKDSAASCVFGVCELPPRPWRIRVTPRNSLAVCGKILSTTVADEIN